jgi:hypothetical protein
VAKCGSRLILFFGNPDRPFHAGHFGRATEKSECAEKTASNAPNKNP